MNILRFLFALLALAGSTHAFAECETPPEVSVPAGGEATQDEMIAAQSGVREYMAQMDEYLTCLDVERQVAVEDAAGEDEESIIQMYNQMHNDGVTLMEELAAEFNEQREAFLAKAAEGGAE